MCRTWGLGTFVPAKKLNQVAEALWTAGAGTIGAYDSCSYRSSGQGTFRALDGAHPFVGEIGQLHVEPEERLSLTFPAYRQRQVEQALLASHPYETPAYSITRLQNVHPRIGAGVIGELPEAEPVDSFLRRVAVYFKTEQLRYSVTEKTAIKRVAICGGAGAFSGSRQSEQVPISSLQAKPSTTITSTAKGLPSSVRWGTTRANALRHSSSHRSSQIKCLTLRSIKAS